MKKLVLSAVIASLFLAPEASAQVCNGIVSFNAGNMRGGIGIRMPGGGNVFDGQFAVSAKTGLFGGANLSISDNGLGGSSTVVGGFLGKPMMVDAKKTLEMCPQGFVEVGDSYNSFGGGVSFGRTFAQTSFDLIPFGTALLHRDDGGGVAQFNMDITGGAGFVLNKKWTIRPSLTIPLTHTAGRDNVFGVAAFLNFGK